MQTENEQVKPDVVAVSNKQLHALVFDCKSGKNAEPDQITRYKKLTDDDLLRWVADKVYARKGFSHDTCYVCLEEHKNALSRNIGDIPLLSVSREKLSKMGTFSKQALDVKFKTDIPITSHMVEPLSVLSIFLKRRQECHNTLRHAYDHHALGR